MPMVHTTHPALPAASRNSSKQHREHFAVVRGGYRKWVACLVGALTSLLLAGVLGLSTSCT